MEHSAAAAQVMGKAKEKRRPNALWSQGLLFACDVGWQTRQYQDVVTGIEDVDIATPLETS